MSNTALKEQFAKLIKEGDALWAQYNALKHRALAENPQQARAEVLKLERLKVEIDDNLKELQFIFYKMEAEKPNF